MEHYKDRAPSETITIIKDYFLNKNYIIEQTSIVKINNYFWCHIELFDHKHKLILAKANGKGITEELCEASAYGELYERYCGNYLDSISREPDALNYSLMDYANTISVALNNGKLLTTEYINLQTNLKKYWSRISLMQLFGSTGLACGNTYEEAVLQGMCEICERYAITKLIIEDKTFGTLIDKYHLDDLDLDINIFDLSNDFHLPIIAIQVIDNKNYAIGYSFSCHPIKEIAIERCLTEFFQGNIIYMDKLSLPHSRLKPNNYVLNDYKNNKNLLNIFKLGKGYIPKEKFNYDRVDNNSCFLDNEYYSNKDMLNDFINKYSINDIYVANLSLSDKMYVVHIFIPSLELEEETNREIYVESLDYHQQELLLNMILKDSIKNKNIEKTMSIISDMISNNIQFFNIFYSTCIFQDQLDKVLLLLYSIYTKDINFYEQEKAKININCDFLDKLCHINLNEEVDFNLLLDYII